MAKVEESVDVAVPVSTAYNQWTQFASFPVFMSGVESVEQLDDKHVHWVAKIAGKQVEWDAEVTEQIPDERVAWKNTTGQRNAGVVTFHRLGDNQSRVMLQLETEPDGLVETVGDKLGVVNAQVKSDLKKFKEFIESQGVESGAWRGQVPRQGS